jgi:hypothetical protein
MKIYHLATLLRINFKKNLTVSRASFQKNLTVARANLRNKIAAPALARGVAYVVVNASASRTEDPVFKSRQGERF